MMRHRFVRKRAQCRTATVLVLVALTVLLSGCGSSVSLLPKALKHGAPHGEMAVQVLSGPHHEALLVARVRIDGKGPFPFLVDTGAAISVVNAPLAAKLHLAVVKRRSGRLQGAGCTTASGEDRVVHWRVGQVDLPPLDVSTVVMSATTTDTSVQGLLGSDLWQGFGSLSVDYRKSLAQVGVVPKGRSVAIRVLRSDGEVVVVAPVTIQGRGPYPFVIDTGASDSVVSRSLAQKFRFHQLERSVSIAAVGCTSKASLVRIPRWSVGSVKLPAGAALNLRDPLGTRNAGLIGIVGSSALSRFGQVTIDYKSDRLIFPN
jgi:predicted aspartyl protease